MRIEIDGIGVFFATGGQPLRPGLPSLVLIHGSGLDHSTWALQSRWFAHHGRNVVAVDLPGHGRSAGAPLKSIEAMADWVAAMLARLEIAHPAAVRALGLVGAAPAIPVHPDILAAAAENRHDAIDMLTIWGLGFSAGLGGCKAPGMWMHGGAEKLWERAAPGVLSADLVACNAFAGGPEAAASITCPMVIVQGSRDAMTPLRGARELAKAIPGVHLTVLEGAGHMLPAERPDEVLAALANL
jgi:pimeloyl-ACP methyl ester carboxylesterase